MSELDLTGEIPAKSPTAHIQVSAPFNPDERREEARGDLARGLLWLLTFAIGGVLAFVGLGRLDGTVITQSIFPSLVALAGTALGFYFGSQSAKNSDSGAPGDTPKWAPLPRSGTGLQMVTVPNLGGLTQAAATTAITGAKLAVGTLTQQTSNTVATGNVISQDPASGSSVAQGSPVNLVVSS